MMRLIMLAALAATCLAVPARAAPERFAYSGTWNNLVSLNPLADEEPDVTGIYMAAPPFDTVSFAFVVEGDVDTPRLVGGPLNGWSIVSWWVSLAGIVFDPPVLYFASPRGITIITPGGILPGWSFSVYLDSATGSGLWQYPDIMPQAQSFSRLPTPLTLVRTPLADPVPAPAALALFGLGALALGVRARRG